MQEGSSTLRFEGQRSEMRTALMDCLICFLIFIPVLALSVKLGNLLEEKQTWQSLPVRVSGQSAQAAVNPLQLINVDVEAQPDCRSAGPDQRLPESNSNAMCIGSMPEL